MGVQCTAGRAYGVGVALRHNAAMHVETWFPTPEPPTRRPPGVWVITVVYGVMYGLVTIGMLVDSPDVQASMTSLSTLDWTLMWLNGALDIAGVASLFLLRRVAVPLLGAALVVSVIGAIALLVGDWTGDTTTLVLSLVMLPVPAGVWWYARRLRQRGILR
jgi:hypothetical protein